MTTAVLSPVTAYAEAVISGSIVAGHLVRRAAERHLRDLSMGHERGLRYDSEEAQRAISFFGILRLADGPGAGGRFELLPWQEFVVGSLFGWFGPDDRRRFHYAFVECGRANGKSPLAAGIGLYALTEGEQGAQVFSAATTRDQAKIVFNDAVHMAELSPSLWPRLTKTVNNLAFMQLQSFFRPLSADASTMDGLRVHVALVDELHEHPNADVLAKLRTGMKSSQPLLFMITTAGYDRHSVCYEEHEQGIKVLEGVIENDAYFAFIACPDEAHTRVYQIDEAMRQLLRYCTCHLKDGANIQGNALTIQIAQLLTGDSVKFVTSAISAKPTRNIRHGNMRKLSNGNVTIQSEGERFSAPITNDTLTGDDNQGAYGEAGELESWHSQPKPTMPSTQHRRDVVPSADSDPIISQLTMTMIRERFEDCSAVNVIAASVYSEILLKAYFEHSITCNARSFKLVGATLTEDIPADTWTDEACWPKANPSLGRTVRLDTLRDECELAKQIPGQQNAFKRLRLNIWTEQDTRWLDMAVWDANAEAGDASGLKGKTCFAGLDLSSTTDLTALELYFPDAEEGGDWLHFYFVPEENMRRRAERDRVPYEVWAEQGFVTATPGNVVDYGYIREKLNSLRDEGYEIQEIAYDPWNATSLVTDLMSDGFTCVPIRQGFASLSAPTKEFEKLLLAGKFRGLGHPVTRWAASNVMVEQDAAGNLKPSKAKSTERIDPIVAMVMALDRASRHEEQQGGVFFV